MVTLTNHVLDQTGFILQIGPLALWRVLQNLLAKCRWKPNKNSYRLSVGLLGAVPYAKPASDYCITFKKRLDEGQTWTKTLNFTTVTQINWLAKIELRGPCLPGRHYYYSLLLYACQTCPKKGEFWNVRRSARFPRCITSKTITYQFSIGLINVYRSRKATFCFQELWTNFSNR